MKIFEHQLSHAKIITDLCTECSLNQNQNDGCEAAFFFKEMYCVLCFDLFRFYFEKKVTILLYSVLSEHVGEIMIMNTIAKG